MLSANLSAIFYLISGVLFILALRGLSSPETSRQGNFFGILGMIIARDIQNNLKEKGHPWEKSKAFDNSCMVGKFLNKNNLEDISSIKFSLKKNNELVQSGCSSDMLWKIDELISYVSQYFTLKIGDLIFTGTPSGVSRVKSGDKLDGFISKEKMFTLKVK